MTNIVAAVIATISATLIAALIIWFLGKRRLYLVFPKLFRHSEFAEDGQTVELTVINRGYRNEEDIRIELSPALKYQTIASTSPSVEFDGSSIHIQRMSKNDEINIIFLVEGGEFSKQSIANISSKETKGTLVESTSNALAAHETLIIWAVMLAFFGAMSFGAYFVGYHQADCCALLESNVKHSAGAEVDPAAQKLLHNSGWKKIEDYIDSEMFAASASKDFPVLIDEVKRTGDIISLKAIYNNSTPNRAEFNATLISPVPDEKAVVDFGDTFDHDIIVFPGEAVTRVYRAYLPRGYQHQVVVFKLTSVTYEDETIYGLEKEFDLAAK